MIRPVCITTKLWYEEQIYCKRNKMASLTFKMKVKILDYWIVDDYKLGSSDTVFCLLEINNKLKLIERELREKWLH